MLQFPRWRVDVTVGGDVVKTFYETATTSAAAIAKAKHKMRGAVSSAGAFKFKATREEPASHHAAKKKSAAQLQREIDEVLAKPANGDAASIADQLTQRDRSTLAWIIEDWPWPYRGYADADMARLHSLGLVEPTTGDTWGGATALGRAVWARARKTWIDEHSLGAAFRRKGMTKSRATKKRSHATIGSHPLRSSEEDMLIALLQGQLEEGEVFRNFFASGGKKRQRWLRALDTRSFDQLDELRRRAAAYGTAAGKELNGAIVDILVMRRSQGRGR